MGDIAQCEIDAWAADLMEYAPDGGESAQQLMQRKQALLLDMAKLPQRRIALVAYGGSIHALMALVAEIPLTYTLNWQFECGAVIALRRTAR